ncbi:MAG TPA: glycoside hydrolase domain-containing protein [Candidatus Acidoferrales bacterium]|nr:glycoside hydrolase domain-containing protein [Candidatus Acidoferrales bacterium]
MRSTRAILFLAVAAAMTTLQARGGVAAVWAVNDGEKVLRDDLANANKNGNSAWDGQRVRLFGARNEVIAFQVIVQSDANGIQQVSVALPLLTNSLDNSTIAYVAPGNDPTQYAGRPIQLYSENYMYIPSPSTADWIYVAGSASAPANIVGWHPVQLVPENARVGRGGFPLTVAANQNRAFWIDIYLSKDLTAGIYRGTLQVSADGVVIALPVELQLFDFVLPDQNSINAMFYYESSQPELYQGTNLDDEYHRFAHRNRVEFVNAYSQAEAQAAHGIFDGSAFIAANGYEGPGEGVGNVIIPNTFYGPGSAYDSQASAWATSNQWMTFLGGFLPQGITFVYMPDEPSSDQYPYIKSLSSNIKSNPGIGKNLPLFVTKQWVSQLDGAIDIWCAAPSEYVVSVATWQRSQGHRYWTYNGGRPYLAAIVIDSPATDPRATIWACFKHGIDTYFYWHTCHWLHNSQKPTNRLQNVWGNPITFDSRGNPGGQFAYGDGVLMYPGTDVQFPDQDRGIPGPVSTVQMANFRRGLQDHLYLTMAQQLGMSAFVNETVARLVPKVFSDTNATAAVSFSQVGNDYEVARRQLAGRIAAALHRRGMSPPEPVHRKGPVANQ